MAVTADIVEVRLEADTSRYLSNLRQAEVQGGRSLDRLAQAAIEGGGAYRQMAQNAVASSQQIVDANQRIASSAVGANLQVGNIAAQFQDIGVTAASGMNPLVIALQQGTQLSAILNQSLSQGVSPVRALGAAFAQIVNPISLGTIAVIALGTAAIQYFGTLLSEGQASEETLKAQNDLIRDVADQWGDAVPALRAYVDQLDRAKAAGDLSQATDVAVGAQYEDLVRIVGDLRAEFAAARIDIQQLGGDAQEIDTLQAAFTELERKAREGTATAEDLNAVITLIGQTSGSSSPGVQALAGVLGSLANGFAEAARQANIFRTERDAALQQGPSGQLFTSNQEFIAEQERINGLTAEQLRLENEVTRVKASAERSGTALGDTQALMLATSNLAAEERRRAIAKAEGAGAKASTKAVTDLERERQAVVDLISMLQFEQSLVGMSNVDKAVANALRQAGAAATEKQREKIEELINATYSEQEAIRAVDEISKQWASTLQSATRGFIDDLIEGKSAAEAFGNVLSSIASQLIDMGLSSIFGGIDFGSIFGGTPTRATGGTIYPNGPTLVGEKGPELFMPSGMGHIVPNSQLGGGGSVVFAPQIDNRGADVAAVARLEQSMQRLASEIVPTIRKEMRAAPQKGRV